MSALEREVKLALESEADYERLCASLPDFLGELDQRNTYWDLPDASLRGAGIMLRLRLEGARALLTVKRSPQKTPHGVFEAPEDEEEVERSQAAAIVAGSARLESISSGVLARLRDAAGPLEGLRAWGSIYNRRRRYRLTDDLIAEVDRTCFLERHVEYEVEVESLDAARAYDAIVSCLRSAGIPFRPQRRTKSERLADYLQSNPGNGDSL